MKKIAIVGGHGNVAMQLARLLRADRQSEVSAVVRKPEQQEDVAATGADPVVLVVEQAGTHERAAAFKGHGVPEDHDVYPHAGADADLCHLAATARRTVEFRDGATPVARSLSAMG